MTRRAHGSALRLLGMLALLCLCTAPALADDTEDCLSDESDRRIEGCSRLIETPSLDPAARSLAYAMRAYAYSVKGTFDLALPDYDNAIKLDPGSAMALNNRAWALFKLRRAGEGMADVERSLALAPESPHAYDTRAHIHQNMGEHESALSDYERAMRHGGRRIIKLYQCGLEAHGLYFGGIDGRYTSEMRRALETCIDTEGCDPLPSDEECRNATS